MLNRVQRLLRGWRRQLAPRRRREPPEGEGGTQNVSRFPAESGEMPVSAGHAQRSEPAGASDGGSVAASTVALAREIRGRLRMGVGRRAIHRARRVSLSEPRPLARYVAPTVTQHVRMTPLPLAGGAPSGAVPELVEGAEIGSQGEVALGQSTGDAAWDALWALRGARSMSGVGPERAQEPAAASEQRPTHRATDQGTVSSPEGSADERAESAAVPRGALAVPARRQRASGRIQARAAPSGVSRPGPDYPVAGRPLGRRVTELGTARHPQRTEVSSPMPPSVEPAMAAPELQRAAPMVTESPASGTSASRAVGEPVASPLPPAELAGTAAASGALRGSGLSESPVIDAGVASSGEAQEAVEPIGPQSTAESLRARPAEGARRQPRRDVRQRGRGSKVQRASHGMPEPVSGEPTEGGREPGAEEMQASTLEEVQASTSGGMQPGASGQAPERVSGLRDRGEQASPEAQVAEQAALPPQLGSRSQPGPASARSTAGAEVTAVPRLAPGPGSAPTQVQTESAAPAPEPQSDRPQVHVSPVPAMRRPQPAAEPTPPFVPGALKQPTPGPSGPQAVQRDTDGGVRPHSEMPLADALLQTPAGTELGSPVGMAERPRSSRFLAGLRRLLPLPRSARQPLPAPRAIERAPEPLDSSPQQSAVSGPRSATRDGAVAEGTEQVPTPASYGETPTVTAPDLARRTIDSHRLEPLLGRAPSMPLPLAGRSVRRAAAPQVSPRSAGSGVASSLGGELDWQMPESGGLQGRASGAERGAEPSRLPGQRQPVAGHPAATAPTVQRAIRGPRDLQQLRQSTLQPMTVQRAASQPSEASAAPAASAAGPAASDAGPGPAGQGEGQDLETMAQEVYRIIRRRLAIERERARGGL